MTDKSLKKVILVVDDDQSLRMSLMGFLGRMGFSTLGAAGGREGLEMISTQKIDLVISDINMPSGNGIDFLEKTRKFSDIPFIMMTGLSTISEARRARASGVKFFLAKPFDITELKKSIINSLDTENKTPSAPMELIQVHLDDFIRGEELSCEAYLRMGKSEFVKVTHGGESLNSDEVARCQIQGIDSLYVLKADFKKILGLKDAFSVVADPTARSKKHDYFNKVSLCLMQLKSLEEMNPSAYFKAQVTLESTLSVLVDHLPLLEVMHQMSVKSPTRLQKSVMLAMNSLLLARNFTEIGPRHLFMLAASALLHEIGEDHVMEKLLQKPREEYSEIEKSIMEAHCVRSVNVLQRMPDVPHEIFKLLLCHHQEKIESGKDALQLNCLKLADEFTTFPLLSPDIATHVRMTQEEIIRSKTSSFSPRVLKAMNDLFGPINKPFNSRMI